jgi:hypothetical protein
MAKKRTTVRFFKMSGEEVNYDFFNKCFSTFDNLVLKANQKIPGGIESDFIKHLLQRELYKQGGWMVKSDGTKIRLYFLIELMRLLLQIDKYGMGPKGPDGLYLWKPKALEYYNKWKGFKRSEEEKRAAEKEDERWRKFKQSVARYDPNMRDDEDDE